MGCSESGGVPPAGIFQSLRALPCGLAGQAVVDVSGRVKADPAMPMMMVVVVHEIGHELSGCLQRAEPFREHRRVLQRLVPRLRKRVVVGNPWPGMGSGDAEVIQQRRNGFARHRCTPVGVDHGRDALDTEDLGHQLDRQRRRLGVVHVRTDDVPGVCLLYTSDAADE